ncbi:hypothetical protein DVH24_005040 [Malus domestica]|uniref:Uncharacterized protein n=1 Tax=Malus domestica TaxID=3750 RepID=A0A498ICD8_MALDO|nr:hypothetical protein DVH24_005040 [Malus domestica]
MEELEKRLRARGTKTEEQKLLGLDGTVTAAPTSASKVVDLPMDHSLTKIDNKIIINSRTPELQNWKKHPLTRSCWMCQPSKEGRLGGLEG